MRKVWQTFENHLTPIMVVVAFSLGIAYAVINIVCNLHGVSIDSTLTEKFYDVLIGELLALGFIKGTKHISEHFGNRGSRVAEESVLASTDAENIEENLEEDLEANNNV